MIYSDENIVNGRLVKMKCFICREGILSDYFVKTYSARLGGQHSLLKCNYCGIVINSTMYHMDEKKWCMINNEIHSIYQGTNEGLNDPKWIYRINAQAKMLAEMFQHGIFSLNDKAIDYGCGDGKLSDLVYNKYYVNIDDTAKRTCLIGKYDKYMNKSEDVAFYTDNEVKKHTFDIAICCSVLEHLIGREQIDAFFDLLNDGGTACIHTLICENVPCDPEWFYIKYPVHCTLWTNRAMTELYKQKNFRGCAYYIKGQMWFFFKNKDKYEATKSLYSNTNQLVFSDDFIDYWKDEPYR